ncbi:MAG: hypothetical protein AAGK22_23110 [Acidobacteriota bacterium]
MLHKLLPLLSAALLIALVAGACQPSGPAEDAPLEEVAVDGGPTETLTVENDPQGSLPQQEAGLTGTLPSNFPQDVPLPLPASITDLGGLNENRYVEVSVARSVDAVRDEMHGLLRGNGWSRAGDGDYRSADGRTLKVSVSGDRNGSTLRIGYDQAVRRQP